MTKPWWHFIKDKKSFDDIVATGMAWELMPDLPFDWKQAEKKLKELAMEEKE